MVCGASDCGKFENSAHSVIPTVYDMDLLYVASHWSLQHYYLYFILVLLLSRKLAADQVLDMGLVICQLTLSLMIAIVASLSILTSGPAINIPVVNILMAITILTVIYATSLTVVYSATVASTIISEASAWVRKAVGDASTSQLHSTAVIIASVSRPTTLTQSSSITMYPQPDYLFSLDIGDYSRAMRNSAYRGGAIFILYIVFIMPLVDEDAPSYLRSLSLQRQSMPRQQRHVQQRPQSILQLPPRRRSASPPKLDTDQLIVLDPALAFSTRSLHTAPSVFTVSSGNSPGMLSLSGHPSPAFTSIEKETRKAIYITKALDDVIAAQSTPNDLSVYASSGPSLILNPNPPSELVKEVSRQRNDKVAKNLITTRQVPTLPLMDSVQDAPTEKTFTPDVSYDASRNEIIPSVTGDRSDTIYSQVKQRPARPTAYRNAYRAPTPAPTPISQADQQERIARPSPPYLDSNYKYGEYPILTKRPTPQNNSTYSTKKSQPLQPGSLLPPAPIESSVQLVPKPEQEQRRARPATLYQDLTPVPTRLKVPTSTFQRDSSAECFWK
ncbi:hypothetical protein BSLG_003733 [Batrachochytrium salamandrivorans]|nr:hypothetical protein BSLG_003733 [Batrachochytrium salamandrivorans]